MINAKLRSGWDKLMAPAGRWLSRTRLTADQVTYLGVALHVVVAWLIVEGNLLMAGLVAIVAAFSDAFDGALAKAKGTVSKWGGFLDSTTDRLSDAFYLVPIAWLYGIDPDTISRHDRWTAGLALAALVFQFLVSYSKARAESLGFDCNVGIAERAERLIVIIAALIFDLVLIGVAVLAALSFITFIQRMVHVRGQARAA